VVGTRREAGITGETTEEMTEGMIGDKIEAEITEMIEETTEEEATEMEDGTLTIAGTMRTIAAETDSTMIALVIDCLAII
jgi:hypothetical protein